MASKEFNASDLTGDMFIPEGLKHLVRGYTEYAKEVVVDRAIPGIDGLKPSQRRILYSMKYVTKVKDLIKSPNVVGDVIKLHPHGDVAVYETMVRLVDSAGIMNIPYLIGKGNFGRMATDDKPAAARYTHCKLAPIADELFGEMEGVDMIPSYDNATTEPVVLPVSFPSILCNPTKGIAVGIASNIPSFNFHEVINATIELIETGDIKGYLVPDFISKGYIVKNEEEFKKLMTTGKARIRLRGKWHVEGKTIVFTELPYYTTTVDIIKHVKDMQGVSDVRDESDRYGLRLAIECSNRKVVDEVLTQILRDTNIQMNITSNIVVIIDNKPEILGVKELLRRWVDFRSQVLARTIKKEIERLEISIPNYEVLVALLSNDSNRKKFVDLLVKSEADAVSFLRTLFPEHKNFDFILSMTLKSISNVQSRINHLNNMKAKLKSMKEDLENIDRVIVRQLKEINSRYSFPRQTEITTEDYVFEKSNQIVKAEPVPVVVSINGKFIKKMHRNPLTAMIDGVIHCMSNDVISFIDTKGRLLRVNLDNLDFVSEYDRGIYLPIYLETEDDFDVICYELITDKKVGYVYSDGFISVVDYGEWVDAQRCTRITQNGISKMAPLIIGEIDFTKSHILLVTEQGRFGFAKTDFKQKHRTARTRLVNVKEGDKIVTVVGITYTEILNLVSSPEKYMDKLSFLAKEDTFNNELFYELVQS